MAIIEEIEDDPVEQNDAVELGSSQSSLAPAERYLVGFVEVKVVGIQYYRGKISGKEMVGLVREPLNPHDPNAIKVVNIHNAQVGHIARAAAAIIAPLIDSHLIMVQGITKTVSGRRNTCNMPCEVHMFATIEGFERVKNEIVGGGLQLVTENNPAFTLSEAAAVKEQRSTLSEKSVDEIFNLMEEALSKQGALDPLEPPNDVIKTELFPHQKEGLRWLFDREKSDQLPPFWEEKEGLYVNVLTNHQTEKRPEALRGGIFADDMGLGKSLTLLSLVATDKCHAPCPSSSYAASEEDIGPAAGVGNKLKRKGNRKDSSLQKKRKTEGAPVDNLKGKSTCDGPSEISYSRTTLLVCPTSVFSSWVKQLELHTRPGSLKAYMYYGERTKDPKKLQKYDIVLTTYSTLASEVTSEESPVSKIDWWRIILDEAHVIKNANARQSRAVTSLNAKRRWVVTGTPIQNDSFDMFSLIAFLRLEPLSIRSFWNSLVAYPLARGQKKGLYRLQVLMAAISLRRTKEKSLKGLPSKTIETFFVDLSVEERNVYDRMEAEARKLIHRYYSLGDSRSYYTNILSVLIRLRQVCVDLALCPSDFEDFPSMEDASKRPELLNKLKLLLDDNDGLDFDCPICISMPTDAVITSCAHIFCRACILKTLRESKQCCPLCRRTLVESDLFHMPPDASVGSGSSSSSSSKSSKVVALLKLLSASQEENPTRKSVIFSQFRKMLLSLEETLTTAGFKVLRVDGSMTAKRRGQVMEEFGIPGSDGATILLASLKATGAGVNLSAASRVYLLEPWWNPAVEEQAMDRVHRIGQREEVKIIRLIARDTVEERILKLQEKKKLLARNAFGKKKDNNNNNNKGGITKSDIVALMHMNM